ncbi:hypothetical protein A3731_23125 [Roseovarius sp. HI0049]|nr:hypothetical protein A3731_23125 [Roseovarius sp. HI0049]
MTIDITIFPLIRSAFATQNEITEIVEAVAAGRRDVALDLWHNLADRAEYRLAAAGVPEDARLAARQRFADDVDAEVEARLRPRVAR